MSTDWGRERIETRTDAQLHRTLMNGHDSASLAAPWIIETHSLTKKYYERAVVDGLAMAISLGQSLGLLGSNGAGKSTVMEIQVTLPPPTSGKTTIAGHDLPQEPALIQQLIGYVTQLPGEAFEKLLREQELGLFWDCIPTPLNITID